MKRPWPLAMLAVLLLAACGGATGAEPSDVPSRAAPQPIASDSMPPSAPSTGWSGTDTGFDACELLSAADITELTTWALDDAESAAQQGAFAAGCLWTLSGGTSSAIYGPATISLGIVEPGGRSYYDRNFAPFADEYGQEPLVGIGDAGLIDGFTNSILAVQDDAFVSIQWLDIGSEDPIQLAQAITARVLSNLAGR